MLTEPESQMKFKIGSADSAPRAVARRSQPAPRFTGLRASTINAAAAARGSSRKKDTACEVELRSALWHLGLRFRKNVEQLPGKPDVVFSRVRLAVFCDGDFWHGNDWDTRRRKLAAGANPHYWVEKIRANRMRDRRVSRALRRDFWEVMRVWESAVRADAAGVAREIFLRYQELDRRLRNGVKRA